MGCTQKLIFLLIFWRSCLSNEAKYTCPQCALAYCSGACYKDAKHQECSENFYCKNVKEALHAEKPSEFSDERESMLRILKKLNNLEESDSDLDIDETTLDAMSAEDMERLLGPAEMDRFRQMLETGVTEDWLRQGGVEPDKHASEPWFRVFKPDSHVVEVPGDLPVVPADLPAFSDLCRGQPSDFMWNNLVDILLVYVSVRQLFDAESLGVKEVMELEVAPTISAMSQTLRPKSTFHHQSVVEALDCVLAAFELDAADYCKAVAVGDVALVLAHPEMAALALSEMLQWFAYGPSPASEAHAIRMKVRYYLSWLRMEARDSPECAGELLRTLAGIVSQYEH